MRYIYAYHSFITRALIFFSWLAFLHGYLAYMRFIIMASHIYMPPIAASFSARGLLLRDYNYEDISEQCAGESFHIDHFIEVRRSFHYFSHFICRDGYFAAHFRFSAFSDAHAILLRRSVRCQILMLFDVSGCCGNWAADSLLLALRLVRVFDYFHMRWGSDAADSLKDAHDCISSIAQDLLLRFSSAALLHHFFSSSVISLYFRLFISLNHFLRYYHRPSYWLQVRRFSRHFFRLVIHHHFIIPGLYR